MSVLCLKVVRVSLVFLVMLLLTAQAAAQESYGALQLTDNHLSDFFPKWSPDNSQIAFSRVPSLWMVPANGGEVSPLTDLYLADNLSWSPDGRRAVFNAQGHLWVLTLETDNLMQLTDTTMTCTQPAWSPDGTTIAFIGLWGQWSAGIFTMPASGGAITRLLVIGAGCPIWSPDGERILYSNVGWWTIPASGGSPSPFSVIPAQAEWPSWSPSGDLILYSMEEEQGYDLYIVSASGGEPQRVTNDPYFNETSSWSPDGSRIVFSSDRGGQFDLWVLELETATNPISWGGLKLLYRDKSLN